MQRHSKPIHTAVIHCTATRAGQDFPAAKIREWHLARGWSDIGYHLIVRLDGEIETGRPMQYQGAHVSGHNDGTIGVVYVGGLDADGSPADTRTPAQTAAIRLLLDELADDFGPLAVMGHRDFPGVAKACPSFDARAEYGPTVEPFEVVIHQPEESTMNDSKPFWASKTLWVNAVALIAAVTGAFGLDLGLDPETQTTIVAAVMAIVNVVLRIVTKGPVSLN